MISSLNIDYRYMIEDKTFLKFFNTSAIYQELYFTIVILMCIYWSYIYANKYITYIFLYMFILVCKI